MVSKWLPLAFLLAAGCSGPAVVPPGRPAPGETRTFEGTWSASGSRRTLELDRGHKASILSLTGSLLLTGERGLGVGFQGEAIGFSMHYLFVSQSSQVLALFGVFVDVGLRAGVPRPLMAFALLFAGS